MKRFGIIQNSNESRQRIASNYWGLIDVVSKKLSSLASCERLLIQTYFVDSGAEIFISKLAKSNDSGERSLLKTQNTFILVARNAMYPFNSLYELLNAISVVGDLDVNKSSLYHSDDGVYYLYVEERNMLGIFSRLIRMNEFSKPLAPLMHSYISEHNNLIIENNAIDVIKEIINKK